MYRNSISKSLKILLLASAAAAGCSETDLAAKLAGPELKATDCVRSSLVFHDEGLASCGQVISGREEEGSPRGKRNERQ